MKEKRNANYDFTKEVDEFIMNSQSYDFYRLKKRDIKILISYASYDSLIELLKKNYECSHFIIDVLDDIGITQEDADELLKHHGNKFDIDVIIFLLKNVSTDELVEQFVLLCKNERLLMQYKDCYLRELTRRIKKLKLCDAKCIIKLKESFDAIELFIVWAMENLNSQSIKKVSNGLFLSKEDYKSLLESYQIDVLRFAIRYANIEEVIRFAMREDNFDDEILKRLSTVTLKDTTYVRLLRAQNRKIREYAIDKVSDVSELIKMAYTEENKLTQIVLINRIEEILGETSRGNEFALGESPKKYCNELLDAKGDYIIKHAIFNADLEVVLRYAVKKNVTNVEDIKQRMTLESLNSSGYYNRLLKSKTPEVVALAVNYVSIDKVINLSMNKKIDESVVSSIVTRLKKELTKEQANELLRASRHEIREVAVKHANIDNIIKHIENEPYVSVKREIAFRIKKEFSKISTKLLKVKAIELLFIELSPGEFRKFLRSNKLSEEDRGFITKVSYDFIKRSL